MSYPSVIQIVRRYGPVGGMEKYVFELSRALSRHGWQVKVLCESDCSEGSSLDVTQPVEVVVLGNRFTKPRWLAQWAYSEKVSQYLRAHPAVNTVIHSHERTAVHHVTTFHGPPFLKRKSRSLDWLSPRIHMWTYLEKRELLARQVRAILPNSRLIADQLLTFYPEVSPRLLAPAYPGVDASYFEAPASELAGGSGKEKTSRGKTVGFLGKEWHRKGLDLAVETVQLMRKADPDVKLLVAGCDTLAVERLFESWDEGYELLGWVEPQKFLRKIDVLLHPARAEPFGMVIAEANAIGVPVVVSDQCGAAELITQDQGSVCSMADTPQAWSKACLKELRREQVVKPLGLTWDLLADQHIDLYSSLLNDEAVGSKFSP
jgi:UDP-glucose:(heptosyl)LPS alpha-1,3-glucosyltransferase